jgi:hypothetical protein
VIQAPHTGIRARLRRPLAFGPCQRQPLTRQLRAVVLGAVQAGHAVCQPAVVHAVLHHQSGVVGRKLVPADAKRQSPRPTMRHTVGTAQSRPRGWDHSQKDGKGLLRCSAKGAAGGTLRSGSASHVDEGPPPRRVGRKVLRRGRVHVLPDPGPLTQPRLPQRIASIRQRRGGAMRAIYAVPAWIALAAHLKRGWGEGEEQVIPPAQPETGPRCSTGKATRPSARQCPCCSGAHQYPALHSPRALHWLKQNCGRAGAGGPRWA